MIFVKNKISISLASPCGLYCGECLHYMGNCPGCVPSHGQPLWGKCQTYACTIEKNVEHCGECADFPCNRFLRQYSLEMGRWRVFYKAGQLVYRKKMGTESWVREKTKGKNRDPKVTIERYFAWEKTQKNELAEKPHGKH